jgi:hypothetical protein
MIATAGLEPVKVGGIEQSGRLEGGGDLHDLVVGAAQARSLIGGARSLRAYSPDQGRMRLAVRRALCFTQAANCRSNWGHHAGSAPEGPGPPRGGSGPRAPYQRARRVRRLRVGMPGC